MQQSMLSCEERYMFIFLFIKLNETQYVNNLRIDQKNNFKS